MRKVRTVLTVLLCLVAGAGNCYERGTRTFWDSGAFGRTPQTWSVDDESISNHYGRIKGVHPIWIEGERYRGKGTRIFAWWGVPEGVSEKVPAMVLVHGGGGTAFAKWVKTWTDRGYAAIAMDTCGKAPRGERGEIHRGHGWSGPEGWGRSVDQVDEPIRDQWTFHAVSAIARCNSFLRSRPEVDANRIGLTGISWGGYLASIAMCVDRRFQFAAPVYGCGYYDLNPAWMRFMCAGEKYRKWLALWDAKNYLQDVHTSGGVRCPILWCNGTNDRYYTLEMLRKSCNLVDPAVPLSLAIRMRMRHGHPPFGDPPEIAAYADHYLKGKARPPRIDAAFVRDGRIRVEFATFGEGVARAELLFTASTNAVLENREWTARPAEVAGDVCEAEVPAVARSFFVNLITDRGLVVSTRTFERGEFGLRDNPRNPAANWMRGKVGVFMHYLPDATRFARIGEFDVGKVVSQLVEMKADYFVFTLGQNSGYFTAPNSVYDEIAGYRAGERCSVRDIPSELIAALRPHGIRFMLYLPCQAPFGDERAVERFGLPDAKRHGDHVVNAESVGKWSRVIREWSVRYGRDVAGWWFDGGYQFIRIDDDVAARYAEAVKAGNPDGIVAFNEGVRHPVRAWTAAADYVPGEIDEPFLEKCASGEIGGRQWHLLTFAGNGWGRFEPRYSDERWIAWLKPVVRRGGAVSLDLGRGATDGVFSDAEVAQLRHVLAEVRTETDNDRARDAVRSPKVMAKAPDCDGRQLCLRCDGEVRCYGLDGAGRRIYLSSPDFGMTWTRHDAAEGDPGPVEVSPWIKWGGWGEKRDRPNAQARYALIGGTGILRSAKWDNRDDVERYVFREAVGTNVEVRATFDLRGFTEKVSVAQDAQGAILYYSNDDCENWERRVIASGVVDPAVFERVDGSLVALLSDGGGKLVTCHSSDRGRTWTKPSAGPFFPCEGAQPRFQRLSDNRLLLVVNDAVRRNRYRWLVSGDDGRTWCRGSVIELEGSPRETGPALTDVLELPDGKILAVLGGAATRSIVMFDINTEREEK